MRTVRLTLLLLSLVTLSLEVAAQSGQESSHVNVRNPLVGTWNLVSLEEVDAAGKVHKQDCSGLFVFTSDGKASVQVQYREADKDSAYSQGAYEASYGSYHVDSSSIFTFHIDGALVRTLIGNDLKRAYKISGNRLTVTSTNPAEHWKVVWERN